MAAPAEITLKTIDGQWVLNRELSSDSDTILKFQGINWLTRKVLNMATVTMIIKEWEDSNQVTHLLVENKPSSGLPSTTEERVFNFEGVESAHPLFGRINGKTRWASAKELNEVDEFLAKGFEEGMESFIHTVTDHLDHGVVTHLAWGFEVIDGKRFHTRHVFAKKGDEVLRERLVYDYKGQA